MNAYEDPDWEAEAEAAEAEEKNAEFWARFADCARKMNTAPPLIVKTLQPGMQLVVTLFEEDGDPLSIEPIEFTILDPKNCKVLVKEKRNFPKPTQGTLLGSEHFRSPPYKRIFQEGSCGSAGGLITKQAARSLIGIASRIQSSELRLSCHPVASLISGTIEHFCAGAMTLMQRTSVRNPRPM